MSIAQDTSFLQYLHNKVVAIADLHSVQVDLDSGLNTSHPNIKADSSLPRIHITVILMKYPKLNSTEEQHIAKQFENLVTLLNSKNIIEEDILKELNNSYISGLNLRLNDVNVSIPSLSYSDTDISFEAHVGLDFSLEDTE